jgi:hypothetical protein
MTINKIKSKILHYRNSLLLVILVTVVSCSREEFSGNQDSDTGTGAPSVPIGLTVYSAHDGAAGIEWNASPESNIKGYNIYRNVNSASNLLKYSFTTDTHFIDYPLGYDTTYYYAISAVNKLDEESAVTTAVMAQPVNNFAPTDISDISINGRNTGTSSYIHLEWTPQNDYDIKGFEIYKSAISGVNITSGNLAGFSSVPYFDDTNVEVLKKYYYKIISVDKGGFKSDESNEVSDLVLDCPVLIYPANNATVKNLASLQFRTSTNASAYRIVIQSNEIYGTVAEFITYSNLINQTVTYSFDSYILTSYRKYYWRVIAYSSASGEPNSFSTLNSFTFVAE